MIAKALRKAQTKVELAEVLEPAARAFYDALPDPAQIWRGCERGRERGLSWSPSRAIAEGFAPGKKLSVNKQPTLVLAEIGKPDILAIFVKRDEDEVVVDPRRLRKLTRI